MEGFLLLLLLFFILLFHVTNSAAEDDLEPGIRWILLENEVHLISPFVLVIVLQILWK